MELLMNFFRRLFVGVDFVLYVFGGSIQQINLK
jgi:hypothetical protein